MRYSASEQRVNSLVNSVAARGPVHPRMRLSEQVNSNPTKLEKTSKSLTYIGCVVVVVNRRPVFQKVRKTYSPIHRSAARTTSNLVPMPPFLWGGAHAGGAVSLTLPKISGGVV